MRHTLFPANMQAMSAGFQRYTTGRIFCVQVLGKTNGYEHCDGYQVHSLLEEMTSEFEEAVQLGGGWTELALPSEEEAQRYFASFRRAPPDNSALVPGTQVSMQVYLASLQTSMRC